MAGIQEANDKRWTILIYQSSDNNLSEECVYALKEIKDCGTMGQVNVFAQLDPVGRGNKTRRFHIDRPRPRRGDKRGTLQSPGGELLSYGSLDEDVVGTYEEVDMSLPSTLRKFLVAGISKFGRNTSHFMLILSGHASGQLEGFFLRDEQRPLSQIPNSFPINQLSQVLAHSDVVDALKKYKNKIDILGFDACLMSVVEVGHELRNVRTLDWVVGSEGFYLNSGWPYDGIVDVIKQYPNICPGDLVKHIVQEHKKFYSDYHLGGLSTDLSAFQRSGIRNLNAAINELAQAMINKLKKEQSEPLKEGPQEPEESEPKDWYPGYRVRGLPFQDAIILAHWAAQSYNGEQCVDLYDFCDLLQARLTTEEKTDECPDIKTDEWGHAVCEGCKKVKDEIKRLVEADFRCNTGAAFQYSHGISIYFPWSRVNIAPDYRKLRYSDNGRSKWFEFIETYVDATQRPPAGDLFRVNDNRSTPPYSKGPEGSILSMRNPPTRLPGEARLQEAPKRSGELPSLTPRRRSRKR